MSKRRQALHHLITIVVVLFIGLALGSSLGEYRLMERVKELQVENETLQRWLEGNITAYNERINLYNSEIRSLKEQIDILKSQVEIEVLGIYFSPRGGCAKSIIDLIRSANKSIHIMIYSFTLDSIGYELIRAYQRGVDVKIVFEKGQITEYSEYLRLKETGVPVRNDTNPALMHNKVMIIDSEIVVTGSYNWTKSAEEENDENIIIIRSKKIAGEYERVFEKIWARGV
ncbi:MAG: phospholipase D family protein [Candidatus Bathyarchaeia archaeon]|nr:phospholipase D family protein [Candidatus Bathyarchaeota archaeon]